MEIDLCDSDHIFTEVCQEGNKYITGTYTNNTFLRDKWEVNIEDFLSLDEALVELSRMIMDSNTPSNL